MPRKGKFGLLVVGAILLGGGILVAASLVIPKLLAGVSEILGPCGTAITIALIALVVGALAIDSIRRRL